MKRVSIEFTETQYAKLMSHLEIRLKGIRGASTKNRRIRRKIVQKNFDGLMAEIIREYINAS